MASQDKEKTYKVVVNHEEQYSIWPEDMDAPLGWRALEVVGSEADCLKEIAERWKDMRPLSIRQKSNT